MISTALDLARTVVLAAAVSSSLPVDDATALRHARLAVEASTPSVPAEVLIATAWRESRFDPTWVSRRVDGVRVVGRYHGATRPAGSTGNLYCGVSAATARTWRRCAELRADDALAYREAALELERWLADRRCRGDLTCAVAGYQGGNRALAERRYQSARALLRRADHLRRISWL